MFPVTLPGRLNDLPHVKLVGSLGAPIEVFTTAQGEWKTEGTLRQLVVAALASRMA